LEAVGVDRVLTIDVHNLASFQNSFRIPVDNLAATRLFIDHLTGCPSFPRMIKDHYHRRKQEFLDLDLVVLSPDIGGMPRCGLFQRALAKRISEICQRPPKEIPLAIFDKTRVDGEVRGSRIIGNVKDKDVLILDDLIASGSTVAKAYDAVVSEGGRVYAICATHGQFTSKKLVADKSLIVTDTVTQIPVGFSNLDVISTIQFVGEAIQRTNSGGSISDLLEC
jgi:ribose-phosphate pyrophosphokinase